MTRDTEIQMLSLVLSFLEDRAEDGDEWAECPGSSADVLWLTQGQVHGNTSVHPIFDADNAFWAVISLNLVWNKLNLIGAVCMASSSLTPKWMLNRFVSFPPQECFITWLRL